MDVSVVTILLEKNWADPALLTSVGTIVLPSKEASKSSNSSTAILSDNNDDDDLFDLRHCNRQAQVRHEIQSCSKKF